MDREHRGKKTEEECDGVDKIGVEGTWAGMYKSEGNTGRRRGNKRGQREKH